MTHMHLLRGSRCHANLHDPDPWKAHEEVRNMAPVRFGCTVRAVCGPDHVYWGQPIGWIAIPGVFGCHVAWCTGRGSRWR